MVSQHSLVPRLLRKVVGEPGSEARLDMSQLSNKKSGRKRTTTLASASNYTILEIGLEILK